MTNRLDSARSLLATAPLAAALRLAPVEIEDGRVTISMPWAEELVGDPTTGVIHGGAISVLMDTAGGGSVLASSDDIAATATLDLRIDYMRPAIPGRTILASAICYHVTRNVAFVRITASDGEEGAPPVAAGTGAFTVERREPAA